MTTTPVKVLLIDDDRAFFLIVRGLLTQSRISYDIDWAESYQQAQEAIASNLHDVCLVDYLLRGHTGIELIRYAHECGYHAPMIMLTGHSNHSIDLEAMNAGAADYLVKGRLDASLLERAIRYALERRRAEDALRRSEEHFRLLIENAQDIIAVLDATGHISYQSPSIEGILGYSAEEMIGSNVFALIHPEDLPEVLALFREGLELPGHTQRAIYRFRHKDGSWRYLESTGKNLIHHHLVEGIVVNSRDVTGRKHAEDQIREAHHNLELRVRERTAEIVEMMAQIEEAHSAQKRFVADASHDIRTPLTIIRGEIDLLLRRQPHGEFHDSLKRVLDESKRLEQLSSDLLILATLDADRTIGARSTVRLDEFLVNCVSKLTPLAQEKSMAWNILIGDPVDLHCDATSMERAICNVLENAIKYSPVGSTITVAMEASEREATIRVTNSGPGIPARDLPRVFDRFYRSDQTRSTPGTGLGLAIVKSVVEAHNGSVSISSSSEGTTVSILLSL